MTYVIAKPLEIDRVFCEVDDILTFKKGNNAAQSEKVVYNFLQNFAVVLRLSVNKLLV